MPRKPSNPADPDPSLFDADASTATGSPTDAAASHAPGPSQGVAIALHQTAQVRYLNYALSVITSRALPDVRDGLKPVQRRILFTMWQTGVTADAKHRKCANVVGAVMGNYHPHGDQAIYDALVRLAQPFSMRVPLIDGSGNFGSLDGDTAAAMRYTECRLARVADSVLGEIDQRTVHFRPNYDGTKSEPVVLPSRLPNLLVNGATGIAVGMATNIPPHNLAEVCKALLKLLDDPEIKTYQLVANDAIQGPDFPTGGQIVTSREELREIYKTGQGAVKVRSTWNVGPTTRAGKTVLITSTPFGMDKSAVVEAIAQVVLSRRLPLLLDVRDLSTDDVRIELVLKRDADEQMVMAYLFKHTPLQSAFNLNLTCLIPTDNPEVGSPKRVDLKEALWHFLHFRLDVVTRRLEHELQQLQRRIHILEGLATVFDALDEIIRIIRASDGKADAAQKIIQRFKLDDEQTDAILELKLYRLAKLEILVIENELKDKRKRVREIKALLADPTDDTASSGRWKIVRSEIQELIETYGRLPENKRRTAFESVADEPEFRAEDFIIEEDNHVVVSRDGWVKRQKEVRDPSQTRLREGDAVLTSFAGSTRATCVFFSNFGTAYTCRVIDVPASTGYGEPIQKLFKLKDGEKIIAACSLDPRVTADIRVTGPALDQQGNPVAPPTHALAVTSDGYALRFGLDGLLEPSTRAGRRYARPAAGAAVVGVELLRNRGRDAVVIAATAQARAMLCKADEINFLSGPGKGVILLKIARADRPDEQDAVLGFCVALTDRDTLTVETSQGAERRINTATYEVTGRGGKGRELLQRGRFIRVLPPEPETPVMLDDATDGK